jgi:O-antigen/teichoic acid export membrane protein
MDEQDSLSERMVSASKWALLGEIAAKGAPPLILLILVRFLTPEDFGVVAIATMVTALSQVFWDAGLSKALVQREADPEGAANVVFWTNAALGLIMYGLLCLFAGFIAHFFGDIRIKSVVPLQGLQVILVSLSSVHNALLQRNLSFRPLFLVKLLVSAVPGVVSIPLAWTGFGYWALVAGSLVGSAAQLMLLWKVSSWRPHFSYDLAVAREMLGFSLWVAAEGLLAWAYLWVDSIIIGAYLAPKDLGLYRVGDLLVVTVFNLTISPLSPVLFSGFSRLRREKERFASALMNSTILVSMISIPVAAGLFLVKNSLEPVFFGSAWTGIANIIGLLAILHGVTWIMGPQIEALRAGGRPDVNTKIMLFGMAYSIPLYLLSVPYGLSVFIWARLLSPSLTFCFRVHLAKRFFSFSWIQYLRKLKMMLALVLVFALSVLFLHRILTGYLIPPVMLVVTGGIFLTMFTGFILVHRNELRALTQV